MGGRCVLRVSGGQFSFSLNGAGSAYFVLRGANHEVLGTSEMYSSPARLESGIAAVKANAPAAVLDGEIRA